jgi:hypothetical protein
LQAADSAIYSRRRLVPETFTRKSSTGNIDPHAAKFWRQTVARIGILRRALCLRHQDKHAGEVGNKFI